MADGFGTSPQFDTAQFKSETANSCGFCGVPLKTTYYRLNAKMACENCATRIQAGLPKDSGSSYMRALLCGFGGALVGMALYATVEILTKFTIGYLALAVGFIVAKAMMLGSKGVGGRKYQITAVLLTYFAISVSAVPVYISQFLNTKANHPAVTRSAPPQSPSTSAVPKSNAPASDDEADAPDQADSQPSASAPRQSAPATTAVPSEPPAKYSFLRPTSNRWRNLAVGIGVLLAIGLASPVLEIMASPGGGFIGLIILFIGLNIAWKMTAGTPRAVVDGPYTV